MLHLTDFIGASGSTKLENFLLGTFQFRAIPEADPAIANSLKSSQGDKRDFGKNKCPLLYILEESF